MLKIFESIKLNKLQKKYDKLLEKNNELKEDKEHWCDMYFRELHSSSNKCDFLERRLEESSICNKNLKDEISALQKQLDNANKEIELYKGVINNMTVHDLKEKVEE